MKKLSFVYSVVKRTVSRTYGGSNYTLRVYQVVKNELVYIGEISGCTRGHKGEVSEAWGLIIEKGLIPARRLNQMLKEDTSIKRYTNFRVMEKFNINLKSI